MPAHLPAVTPPAAPRLPDRVDHHRHHPDAHNPWQGWSDGEVLHVAVPYSNPFRWRTRRELANDFRRHMAASPNVVLHMGELAYGDRPFEVTDRSIDPNDVQLRTSHELFHKENIANAIIKTFPPGWRYGAVIDGDFHFTRHDWALEAIHQLQHYDWVQLFSSYADLSGELYGQGHRITRVNNSFAFNYVTRGHTPPTGYSNGGWKAGRSVAECYYDEAMGKPTPSPVGATGGAWAFRRSAFDACGGLLDKCILGHGDWFMAFGLACGEAPDMHIGGYTPDYLSTIHAWQRNAARLHRNIGYVDCFATHHWHGPKDRRAYSTRDLLLVQHQFSPTTDLRPDYQGIYQLTPDKPALRDAIRAYFTSRCEDLLV